ncbi:hypothetical protein J3Q64DRAFT_1641190, partial [Phycomyces blakesleeanus]
LSSYINHSKASKCLARKISAEFGWPSVLMVKNWYVYHNKSHEAINGVVIRCLPHKHGSDLCLFDTFSTSKHYFSYSRLSL